MKWSAISGSMALAAGLFVGVGASPAAAVDGSCPRPAPAAAMQSADVVFAGTVAASVAEPTGFFATVMVSDLYKGSLLASTVEVHTDRGACGLGKLVAGQEYIVMATTEGPVVTAGGASGTQVASPSLVTRVTQELGDPTPVAEGHSGAVVRFQDLDVAEPIPWLRAAAPGLAMALVGGLGLLAAARRRA